MPDITIEDLHAYLDEALPDGEAARIEQALRTSASLRQIVRGLLQERDRGEHSVGAIWRRQRLSCPNREQLGSYMLEALDDGLHDYIRFHLETIGCPYCSANLADLQNRRREPSNHTHKRRKKIFESSAGFLHVARDRKPR
jgi:hypothetical protein